MTRFFAVNTYAGKGKGARHEAREFTSEAEAADWCLTAFKELMHDAGECLERFQVFIGSRRQLDQTFERVKVLR